MDEIQYGKVILQTVSGSAASETGAEQTLKKRQRDKGRRALIQCKYSSGDTVVIKGKLAPAADGDVIATFNASNEKMQAVDLPPIYWAERTVDGTVGEAIVWVDEF